jgi:hypothetical protein
MELNQTENLHLSKANNHQIEAKSYDMGKKLRKIQRE